MPKITEIDIELAGGALLRNVVATTPYSSNQISANWSLLDPLTIPSSGSNTLAGHIRLRRIRVASRTLHGLGTRVTTSSSGGLFSLAIYADDPTLNRPTTLLGATGSLSTTSSVAVGGNFVGSDVILAAGQYIWEAYNMDNATSALAGVGSTQGYASAELGSATIGNTFGSSAAVGVALDVTQTFGTWPSTLVGASFTESLSTNRPALVGLNA